MKQKYQKRTRLKDFSYKGFWRYFVTIATHNGRQHFKDKECVKSCLVTLKNLSASYHFNILAYCFMPDHLHLLIEGKEENSDFKRFLSMFKQKANFHFKKIKGNSLWQENYYEHVLRKEEDTIQIVKYILQNPVRKGMVVDWRDYSFLGSFVYDLKELSS